MDIETIDDIDAEATASEISPGQPTTSASSPQKDEPAKPEKEEKEARPHQSTPAEKSETRRDVAAPDDNREFPL